MLLFMKKVKFNNIISKLFLIRIVSSELPQPNIENHKQNMA